MYLRLFVGAVTGLVLLFPLAGCTTIASLAVKHVASQEGMTVAKNAYHKLKGDDKDNAGQQAAPVMEREIVVTTNPPGAKIEVNGKYFGNSPVQLRVQVDSYGGVKRDYVIRAMPMQKGQHVQKYRLVHYQGEPGERPPAHISFDMTAKKE